MRVGMEDDLEIWKPEIKFTDRNEFGPDQDIGTAVSGPQFDRGGGGGVNTQKEAQIQSYWSNPKKSNDGPVLTTSDIGATRALVSIGHPLNSDFRANI